MKYFSSWFFICFIIFFFCFYVGDIKFLTLLNLSKPIVFFVFIFFLFLLLDRISFSEGKHTQRGEFSFSQSNVEMKWNLLSKFFSFGPFSKRRREKCVQWNSFWKSRKIPYHLKKERKTVLILEQEFSSLLKCSNAKQRFSFHLLSPQSVLIANLFLKVFSSYESRKKFSFPSLSPYDAFKSVFHHLFSFNGFILFYFIHDEVSLRCDFHFHAFFFWYLRLLHRQLLNEMSKSKRKTENSIPREIRITIVILWFKSLDFLLCEVVANDDWKGEYLSVQQEVQDLLT